MTATEYWQERYRSEKGLAHHSLQNKQISEDFLRYVARHPAMMTALNSDWIIEIGCGTGELAVMVKEQFATAHYYATDFNRTVINHAQEEHPEVGFWVFDVLSDGFNRRFDLAICSNVLEHFRTPHTVINNIFHFAEKLLLLVPFDQPTTDGYDEEGGAGHVFQFTLDTFSPYEVYDSFTFPTQGWQHSSEGETPLQLAIMLSQ